ncbi:MAG TPA: ABC transporter ATP-binding protein [Candidatus Faecicola pullistercoris]|nr:ABC transporter ATP-binding protein [Candidatus Faecicola pullistercoris]
MKSEVRNLVKEYTGQGGQKTRALSDVSFTFESGELISITGKSGSGKSTLLKILGGQIPFDGGSAVIEGVALENATAKSLSGYRNTKIGLVYQDFMLVDDISVIENVMLPLYFRKMPQSERYKKAAEVLTAVNMKDKANRKAGTLSGGEKQRVAVARALVKNPAVILADEPTGALDVANGAAITELLFEINAKGKTVIIVTHDEELADKCRRKIVLSDGKITKIR